MTPHELNARIQLYRQMIARWQVVLATTGDQTLYDDIRDLESWIGFILGPIERVGFANANGKLTLTREKRKAYALPKRTRS